MRLAVYDDHVYRREGDVLWTERTFPLFLAEVGWSFDELILVGRLDPRGGTWNFELPYGTRFAGLPHYESLASPLGAIRSMVPSLRRWWSVLDEVDAVWVMGPHPLGFAFVLLALARRKPFTVGVRQDLCEYVHRRHPGRRAIRVAAVALEAAWRGLARGGAVVAVGSELASQYGAARRLHELRVSLVRESDIAGPEVEACRRYDGTLRILTVGRLDTEKNPLLLADVVALLASRDSRWEMLVCGTGPLEGALRRRLADLGVDDRVKLRGYVSLRAGLLDLYRDSHVFLHVSWTEGVPQVLFEAFASRLPVVATAVGGVAAATGTDAVLLIDPGDAEAAVSALDRIAGDQTLRRRLVDAGLARARAHTMEAEASRVAAFLHG